MMMIEIIRRIKFNCFIFVLFVLFFRKLFLCTGGVTMIRNNPRLTITIPRKINAIINQYGDINKSGFISKCIAFWYEKNIDELERLTNEARELARKQGEIGTRISEIQKRRIELQKERLDENKPILYGEV